MLLSPPFPPPTGTHLGHLSRLELTLSVDVCECLSEASHPSVLSPCTWTVVPFWAAHLFFFVCLFLFTVFVFFFLMTDASLEWPLYEL